MNEMGPIYGVELIDTLPLGNGMLQAMPSRDDLLQVKRISERTVAGYEVLLDAYRKKKPSIPHNAICTYMDGDSWCAVFGDFENLQESPAGFGGTVESAVKNLQSQHEAASTH